MGLKAAQKVRQVRHNSSANFELENVGRTFELKAEPATPWYREASTNLIFPRTSPSSKARRNFEAHYREKTIKQELIMKPQISKV